MKSPHENDSSTTENELVVSDRTESRTRFPKSARLLNSDQFRSVFDAKQSVSDDQLIVYGVRNGFEISRLGLVVSRKVGNAVIRNRWKRHIREAFRLQQHHLPQGIDLVVLPRRGAKPTHLEIFNSLRRLAIRLEKRIDVKEQSGLQKANTESAANGDNVRPSKKHFGRGRGQK